MCIRPARLDDVPVLAHVHRESRASYYGTEPDAGDAREEIWDHFLRDADRTTYVAELDGRVVGILSTHGDELDALYVLPDRFGTGTGSRLHDLFVAELPPHTTGRLEVWAGNDRAVGFYVRRGWVPVEGRRPGPQGHDYVTYVRPPRSP